MEVRGVSPGLARIRTRRWLLWTVFLTYVPAIWLSLRWTRSDAATAVVFGVWILMATVAGALVGLARCPRCGNYYHIKGLVPVWVRRCLHCDLALTADRKGGAQNGRNGAGAARATPGRQRGESDEPRAGHP